MWKKALLLWLGVLTVSGCGGTVHVKTSKELTNLLSSLEKRNADIAQARVDALAREIRSFTVNRSTDGSTTVDMDVFQAHPEQVFLRLMKDSGMNYRMGDVSLAGRVTAKTSGMPLLDAVRLIVEAQGVMANITGDTLVLDYAPRPFLTGAIDASTYTVTRSVDLRYLDTDAAFNLLDQTFPAPRPLNIAKVPERNTVYLTGAPSAVQQAVDLLTRVDRYPKIVMIEALVIEFDSDAFETLGAYINSFQLGKAQRRPAQLPRRPPWRTFNANRYWSRTPLAFTAIINALFEQDKARLISRPYVSVLSGKPANINLTTNQYVVVQAPSAGAAVFTTQSIKAGVVMNITPTVASGGVIRLQMSVEDSQFVPTAGNTAVEVNQDNASSFMTLLDGQTTIIGGMVVKRVSSDNIGLPWLRRIPIINLFTSNQQATEHHAEVAIYLTPHIIEEPSMDLPMVKPHAMEMDPFWGNFTPSERMGHQEPAQ